MATDPFRSLFLRQVRAILSSAPSRESLRQLLATADPDVTDVDLDNETIRTRVLKELRKRVHPDKHPNDDTATGIFQDLPPFYEACCRRLHVPVGTASSSQNSQPPLRRRSSASESETTIPQTSTTTNNSRGVSLPSEFTVTDKWPYIPLCHPVAPQASVLFPSNNNSNNNDNDDASTLELLLAYQCINARGAVAHRAKPGLFFGWNKVTAEPNGTTAEQLWQKKFRGARRFGEDINDMTTTTTIANQIKEELMTRGPVVSVSFVLSPVLKQHGGGGIADAFFWQQRMNQTHAVMIVGWKLTAFGEVWLVHPPRGNNSSIAKHKSISDILIPIAFGQFGIDTLCLAPASDLLDKSWQPGPFFDLNLSKWPDKWMGWKKCDVHLTANELQRLSECLGTGFVAAATSGRKESMRFVLRDEKKLAHSRAFCLRDVQWNPEKKMWKITIMRLSTD